MPKKTISSSFKVAFYTCLVTSVLPMPPVWAADDKEFAIEEVVVTARRRTENLMDTPVSITAFSGADLTNRSIERINDIAEAVPNVEFRSTANASSSNNNAIVFIRGVGQSDFVPSVEPGVGIYVDEAYIPGVAGAVMNLVDIESIQVLRGPQGTLFGRNTIGGAVLINTVKPGNEFGGQVDAIGGNDDWMEAKASLNLPISNTLFSRATILARDRDGWVDYPNVDGDDGGGSDETLGARIALRWEPSDDLTVDFNADYTNSKSDGATNVQRGPISNDAPGLTCTSANVFPPPGVPSGCTTVGQYNFGVAPALGLPLYDGSSSLGSGSYTNLGTQIDGVDSDIWGMNLTVNWDMGWANVKSITNYRNFESIDGRDEDSSPIILSRIRDDMDAESWSQEIQISGLSFNDRLNWTTGFYYSEDDTVNLNPVDFPPFGLVSGSIVEKTSMAVFAQGTYEVTSQLSLTMGLRYTMEDKDFIVDDRIQYVTRLFGGVIGGPPIFLFLPPNAFTLASKGVTTSDHNELDPYVNLSYHWSDNLMTYFSYSEGFKGGGFVQRIVPGADVTPFSPEFATVYEVGFKWEGMESRLRLTGAAFFNDYTDLHIVVQRGIAPSTENAGDAEVFGGELEMLWLPLPDQDLRISAGLGILDAEYKKLAPTATIPITNELPSVADVQYNVSASYTLPQDVFSGSLTLRMDYSWTDDYELHANNLTTQESYGLLNASVTWISESENWEVSFRGRNVTDELYLGSPQNELGVQGYTNPTVGRDAQFSGRVTYRF